MSTNEQVIDLLEQAMALLGSVKATTSAKKPRAESKRGGNKGLIKLDLQRKLVLAEMVEVWSKLPESKRTEKTSETHTTKAGKDVTKEVYVNPQPTYKDAISECKRRKDNGEVLPEVDEDDIDAVWRTQQDKKSSDSLLPASESEKEPTAPAEKPAAKDAKDAKDAKPTAKPDAKPAAKDGKAAKPAKK